MKHVLNLDPAKYINLSGKYFYMTGNLWMKNGGGKNHKKRCYNNNMIICLFSDVLNVQGILNRFKSFSQTFACLSTQKKIKKQKKLNILK